MLLHNRLNNTEGQKLRWQEKQKAADDCPARAEVELQKPFWLTRQFQAQKGPLPSGRCELSLLLAPSSLLQWHWGRFPVQVPGVALQLTSRLNVLSWEVSDRENCEYQRIYSIVYQQVHMGTSRENVSQLKNPHGIVLQL